MDGLALAGVTQVFEKAGLSLDTGATTYDTATFDYCIDGIMYTKSAVTNGTTPTTDHNGAAFTALSTDETCWFLWCVNASGTVSVVQGNIVDVDGNTDLVEDVFPTLPSVPDGVAPFAACRMQTTGASSAWTFGTSNWDATGLTELVIDLSTMPARAPTTVTA